MTQARSRNTRTKTRRAFHTLLETLAEVEERWAGPEWGLRSKAEVAEAHRALMHILEGGLVTFFENEVEHPIFRRIVSPTRKFTGDNPDALYFDAAIRANRAYRVRGRMDGAVYVSFTVEMGSEDGGMSTRTGGVLNDTQFDVNPDGSFEIFLGGKPRKRGSLPLEKGASRITARYYYEGRSPAAADPGRNPALHIEPLDPGPLPQPPSDPSVAAGIARVAEFVRSRTLGLPPGGAGEAAPFISNQPNQFPKPVEPGEMGGAAADAAYSMAPYVIAPDEALVMTGHWPECRCANVCLWNRHMQSYDYANRQVYRNRRQTRLEADGSFRIVLAHRDPGVPNWIDTEGRTFGMVFWRFMLPRGDIETPHAEVFPFRRVVGRR
ncbi:MAG: DUF1214 domain-containing protein [Deltaproteobacteria bacterium]|nr:DUF1214 domain-containing protein [Deltaproteobacteria bacterium]